MNHAMFAVIKKDFRGITANKRLFSSLWIVPLMLTVVLPSILTLAIHFAPEDPDFRKLLEMLPSSGRSGTPEHIIAGMILDYILPVFFLIVPIMAASVMAASSFVGEKEKHTLETLLYCPLSVKQIFQAKVLASFFLSMFVSLLSFGAMLLVLETELFFLSGTLLLPGSSWAVILLLVSPAISLIAVTLIVRSSAKSRSTEESQQAAVFLVLPVVLLIAGQFAGVLLLNTQVLLGIGAACALLAALLLKKSMSRFTYERLLMP